MLELTIIQKIIIWALPILLAVTLHEVAHGWVASYFGDQTARFLGRLTLNPLKHIDPIGTLLVPLLFIMLTPFVFGWAKPVPVDPRNLRKPEISIALVAAAGPFANLLMALCWAGIAKLGLSLTSWQNMVGTPLVYMGHAGILINVILGVVNCLPIPPLDGSKIIGSLSKKIAWLMYRLQPYGLIVLPLLMMSGILNYIVVPPIRFIIISINTLFGL